MSEVMQRRWLREWVADVISCDINLSRLRYLSETLPKNVKTLYASELRIKKELPDVDLVIGSVLIPGDKAPHLITRNMLAMMRPVRYLWM